MKINMLHSDKWVDTNGINSISKFKKSNYSILAPLDLIIKATKSNLVIQDDQQNKCLTLSRVVGNHIPSGYGSSDHKGLPLPGNLPGKELKEMLRERIFYISHPSLSNLECSINLSQRNIFFEETVKKILVLGNFNPKQIEIRDKSKTILFKDVAAMKLLNIIFKDNEDHALYPIYLKWIDGSEWMKY